MGVSNVCNVAYFEVLACSSGEELISTRLGGGLRPLALSRVVRTQARSAADKIHEFECNQDTEPTIMKAVLL